MITIGIDASRANIAQRTGTEWYAWHILEQFKQLIPAEQWRVVLYMKDPPLPDLLPLPNNWRVVRLRWPFKLLWTQLRLSLHFFWPWQRPDLLYIPAHTIPIIHPRRVVYVAHDLGFERRANLYNTKLLGGRFLNAIARLITFGRYGTNERDYHRWSMKLAVNRASLIIAISQFTAGEIKAFYPTAANKIKVIYNGFAPPLTPIEAVTGQRDCLLYIGRIEHKKNLLNLINAYAVVKQTNPAVPPLICVGSLGYGADQIQQRIKDQSLSESVILTGYIEQTELKQYWRRARLFIFPSAYEGFGIPVLEALSAGALVTCSDLPALREVGGEACWYFQPDDPKDIARAISAALSVSAEEREQRLKLAAQQTAKFSWSKCASQTWQVLVDVLH